MTSASSPQGKRKRSTSHLPVPHPSSTELQPSSRDASGEEGEDTTTEPANVTRSKSKKTSTETVPASKRARKSSDQTGANGHKEDPGEPSETTIASSDIENQEKVKGRPGLQIKVPAEEGEQNAMSPPERGGLQDPVGYHTNPPPSGRAVRVYADGVFDLFHLGFVLSIQLKG